MDLNLIKSYTVFTTYTLLDFNIYALGENIKKVGNELDWETIRGFK